MEMEILDEVQAMEAGLLGEPNSPAAVPGGFRHPPALSDDPQKTQEEGKDGDLQEIPVRLQRGLFHGLEALQEGRATSRDNPMDLRGHFWRTETVSATSSKIRSPKRMYFIPRRYSTAWKSKIQPRRTLEPPTTTFGRSKT